LKKGRPKKWWKEVVDVIRYHGSNVLGDLAAETGLPLHAGTTNRAPAK